MRAARTAAAIVGGLTVGALGLMPAHAAVITTFTNQALSTVPVVASLGGGLGTLSFTAADTLIGPGAAVATGGDAMVTMIFGAVADYGPDTVFDGTASFDTTPSPSAIQYSAADDFIGFTYMDSAGTHLGYAEVAGPTLIGYAYESVAGASITGSTITASSANPVPEPASLAVVAVGLAGLGFTRARKRRTAQA